MSWDGYFKYGDVEIMNATRTQVYADEMGLSWVKATGTAPALAVLLGETYVNPVLDEAPWYDPDVPQSADFAGLIPLSVTGLEDSTRESTVFEFTTDGGNPGSIRNATKPVVFSVALVGATECAVEYGFRWLKRALLTRQCAPGAVVSCRGERLYYARCMPTGVSPEDGIDYDGGTPSMPGGDGPDEEDGVLDGGSPWDFPDPEPTVDWLHDYERHLENVVFNRGPVINSKKTLKGCNGAVWIVGFTATAGDPFEYGALLPVLAGLGQVADPYVAPYDGAYGITSYSVAGCAVPSFAPFYDPANPALVVPPAPPNVAPANFTPPSGTWNRRYAELPAILIPLWDEVRPVITLRSIGDDARMVWVRFYPETDPTNANCDPIGEFLISYLPGDVDFVIDSALRAIYVDDGSGSAVRRADSLVYGSSDAKPVKWFGLSCGDAYRVTLDWDNDASPDLELDLALVPKSA